MELGVLSDTHLGVGDDPGPLGKIIKTHMAHCPVILHAGDLVHLDHFYEVIPRGVQFFAVSGNMDVTGPSSELPARRVLEFEGFRIGLTHGSGGPGDARARAAAVFQGESLDAIVFGHSHRTCNKVHGTTLFFNPGSTLDRRSAPYHTAGILTLGVTVTGRILKLEGF